MHRLDISPQATTIDLLVSSIDLPVATVGSVVPRASSIISARAPVVTGVRSATVAAVRATATKLSGVPVVTGSNALLVTAVRAQATAAAFAPVIPGSAIVNAVRATSTALAYASINPVNANVTAVRANSTSFSPAQVISGEAVLTGGGPGLSTAMAYVPVVSVVTTTPLVGSVGTQVVGNLTTVGVPVPASVANNDVVLVFVYLEDGTQAVTPSAGFSEAPSSPVPVTGSQPHALRVFWKRATGADTGTYAFTVAPIAFVGARAIRFTGVFTTGTPLISTSNGAKTATTDALTPALSGTTSLPGRLWVWAATGFGAGGCATLSGWTEQFDNSGDVVDTLPALSPGTVGPLVGTFANPGASAAWLGALAGF